MQTRGGNNHNNRCRAAAFGNCTWLGVAIIVVLMIRGLTTSYFSTKRFIFVEDTKSTSNKSIDNNPILKQETGLVVDNNSGNTADTNIAVADSGDATKDTHSESTNEGHDTNEVAGPTKANSTNTDETINVDENKTESNGEEPHDDKNSQEPQTEDAATQNDDKHPSLEELALEALRFSEERNASYEEAGRPSHWKMRGTGYLFVQQNLLLAAILPEETLTSAGPKLVTIHNVMPYLTAVGDSNTNSEHENDCDKLTIWVRVNGPEIFAGIATAVPPSDNETTRKQCHWEFSFDLRVPGDYEVDAKVLVWDGKGPFEFHSERKDSDKKLKEEGGRCLAFPGNATEEIILDNILGGNHTESDTGNSKLVSGGFIGFKLYYPVRSCCEICTRTHGCIYWATPPQEFPEASRFQNGCELYFNETDADFDPEYVPSVTTSGIMRPRPEPNRTKTTNSDDSTKRSLRWRPNPHQHLVRASRSIRILDGLGEEISEGTEHGALIHRRRRLKDDMDRYHGRPAADLPYGVGYFLGCGWSFWFTLDYPCANGDLDDRVYSGSRKTFSFVPEEESAERKEPELLPLCTIEDEISDTYRGRYVRKPWPSEEDCGEPRYDGSMFDKMVFDPDRPHCWYRDDLSRVGLKCMEMNCKLIDKSSLWISSLHQETEWYGYWQNDKCDYLEYTTFQLQQCILDRKITSINFNGASISSFLEQYGEQRTVGQNIEFYKNETDPEAMEVTVKTLKLLHISFNDQDTLTIKFRAEPNATDSHEYYFMNSLFSSSERDALAHVDYQHNITKLAEAIVVEKGWGVLNAFDLSAAFTYDSATQNDGLHIIGPPMKTVITKLFHHICRETSAEGTVVGKT